MKKCILIFVFFLTNSTAILAQNILNNPSFQELIGCPTYTQQVDSCKFWKPMGFTPDFFHSCNTYPPMGYVTYPQNVFGYQTSYSGSYLGLCTYSTLPFPTLTAFDYREYIGTTFTPLEIGATYKVTVVVSLADSSSHATNGLGVYFYSAGSPVLDSGTYAFTPQIDYSSYGVITDEVNWTTLTNTFVADSAYTKLIIGSFKDDATASIVVSTGPNTGAYYFIDSVSVEKILSTSIPILFKDINASLYPNPFSEHAVLSFNNETKSPHDLIICDLTGRRVMEIKNITTNNVTIQRLNLETGLYYYQLYNANNLVGVGKMIVE